MAYDSAANKDLLYGRQGGVCVGCRLRFPQRNMTVDHIRPQSMGGGHGIGNLQLLCAACNSLKGAGSHEALIAKLVAAGIIVLKRNGKYAHAGGRGSTMGPVAVAVLVAVAPVVAVEAVEKGGPLLAETAKKYGPRVAGTSKRAFRTAAEVAGRARERASRAVAEGADEARERARSTGRTAAEGAHKAAEWARLRRRAEETQEEPAEPPPSPRSAGF